MTMSVPPPDSGRWGKSRARPRSFSLRIMRIWCPGSIPRWVRMSMPSMNGIGGDAYALIWEGGKLHGLNASGRAPAAWTPGYFSKYGSIPKRGWDSVTVPGAVSAWRAVSERFGKLPFEDLFEPALRY